MNIDQINIELFDWIVYNNCIKGSKLNDNGMWLSTTNKPITFNNSTRIIMLEDGKKYLIKRETVCKALGLDKKSEKILGELSV